jgi:hypothetical protein
MKGMKAINKLVRVQVDLHQKSAARNMTALKNTLRRSAGGKLLPANSFETGMCASMRRFFTQ